MALTLPIMCLFPDLRLTFCHSQAINSLPKPRAFLFPYFFSKILFMLISMVDEACLPSYAYFP